MLGFDIKWTWRICWRRTLEFVLVVECYGWALLTDKERPEEAITHIEAKTSRQRLKLVGVKMNLVVIEGLSRNFKDALIEKESIINEEGIRRCIKFSYVEASTKHDWITILWVGHDAMWTSGVSKETPET